MATAHRVDVASAAVHTDATVQSGSALSVAWKKVRLAARNDRKDVECLHNGEGRWLWTPLVMEAYAAPSGPRRRTVVEGPGLRSCCMRDPIARVRWWNLAADLLQAASGFDADAVVAELTNRVPLPTLDEELMFAKWPHDAPWQARRRIDHAAAERENFARDVRCEVVSELRPAEMDWREAVSAWQQAEAARDEQSWAVSVAFENEGIQWIERAIAKARHHERSTAAAEIPSWLDARDEHVRRREEMRSRFRAEEKRRRQREADEQRRRAADEARQRAERRSVVDRVSEGFVTDWAAFLGVEFPCTHEALKRAHRDAALRHHPDRGGDPEMMKAANIAKAQLEAALTSYWTICT